MANVFKSMGRLLCTLSTVFGDEPTSRNIEALVNDASVPDENGQMVLATSEENRPKVRVAYQMTMMCVDNADQHVSYASPTHRKRHWSTAEVLWVLTMLVSVNAKKVYESATGNVGMNGRKWRDIVRNVLLNPDDSPHPESKKLPPKTVKSLECKSCRMRGVARPKRTRWRCAKCGPICDQCEALGTHREFVKKRPRGTHHLYPGEKFPIDPMILPALRPPSSPPPENNENCNPVQDQFPLLSFTSGLQHTPAPPAPAPPVAENNPPSQNPSVLLSLSTPTPRSTPKKVKKPELNKPIAWFF